MKKIHGIVMLFCVTMLAFSCQKEISQNSSEEQIARANKNFIAPTAANCSEAYSISLVRNKVGCNYEYIWSVQNNNPGNGSNGTFQDLSHWGFIPCADFSSSNVIEAQYRIGNGDWMELDWSLGVDNSQGCQTSSVLKFDEGTTGSQVTQFRLLLNARFAIGGGQIYYKSGINTGCCTYHSTSGVLGCIEPECLYSQGYFFARPHTIWDKTVSFGSLVVDQEAGVELWKSRQGNEYENNNSIAKRAFFQASAIQLNVCDLNSLPAHVKAAYDYVANFLSGLTYHDLLTGDYDPNNYSTLSQNIGVLSNYIEANHCGDDDYENEN